MLRSNGFTFSQQFIEDTFKDLIGSVIHGIGESTPPDTFEANMIPFTMVNREGGFDFSKAVFATRLGKQ